MVDLGAAVGDSVRAGVGIGTTGLGLLNISGVECGIGDELEIE